MYFGGFLVAHQCEKKFRTTWRAGKAAPQAAKKKTYMAAPARLGHCENAKNDFSHDLGPAKKKNILARKNYAAGIPASSIAFGYASRALRALDAAGGKFTRTTLRSKGKSSRWTQTVTGCISDC